MLGEARQSQAALRRLADERCQPLSAHLELTRACNWQCAFCYLPPHAPGGILGVADWISVLDELRALGTLVVTFTGGEPLLHPGFLAIARAARARAFAVRVLSNGSLVDDEMADALAALQPLGVELSLHGARPATHDALTRRPGSFEATLAGLRRLQARRVRLVLKTVLTRRNEHELEAILALAGDLGVRCLIDPEVTPRDDGDASPLACRASLDAIRSAYREVARRSPLPSARRREGGPVCALGRSTLGIDPRGEVFPCLRWHRESIGNVRTAPLRELWPVSAIRRRAAEIAARANERLISMGEPDSSFPFCPALACAETGDPLLPASFHRTLAAIVSEVRKEAR